VKTAFTQPREQRQKTEAQSIDLLHVKAMVC
jgi:hypothetical protein